MKATPHAWNRDFAWQPPRGAFRRIDAAQARSWDEQGYFVLEDAFDAATVQRVIAEIDPFEQKSEAFLRKQPGGRLHIARADEITFTTHLVARSPYLREFARSPVFCDLVHDLIGPDVRLYWDQAVYKKPGTRADFPWHQDNGYTFVEPQQYLTCWVALTDATPENGCPWVAPGLHRRGTLRHWMTDTGWRCLEDVPEAVPLPVRAGGIAVFSSLTPHRTGPNRTDAVRKAYIVQLAPEGARIVQAGPDGAPVPGPAADDPQRQYPILVGGAPVAPPPLGSVAA
jgi:ectoine hydroxylase-related dioxygenase (phytanoyl-CoA dioxygenase family)